MKNTAKLEQLTSLRFFAALMIVFHHADGLFGIGHAPLNLGQGVSFFFVLSGFILTFVYPSLDSGREVRRFWLARFARIWPAYLVTFLFAFALLLFEWNTLTGVAHLAMVQAWVPLSVFYFSYNAVAWSISTEAFFYLAFPALIRNWARTWQVKLAATIVLLVALVAVTNALHLPEYANANNENDGWKSTVHGLIYVNPLARLLEFVTGMVLARFWVATRSPSAGWTIAEIAALAACGAAMYYTPRFAEVIRAPLGDAAALWMIHSGSFLAFASVVLVMAQGAGAISRLLRLRPLVVLGEISFSLYLLHQTLLSVWRTNEWWQGFVGGALFFSALLGLSALVWRVVEMPARRGILSLARPRQPPAAPSLKPSR